MNVWWIALLFQLISMTSSTGHCRTNFSCNGSKNRLKFLLIVKVIGSHWRNVARQKSTQFIVFYQNSKYKFLYKRRFTLTFRITYPMTYNDKVRFDTEILTVIPIQWFTKIRSIPMRNKWFSELNQIKLFIWKFYSTDIFQMMW